MVWNEVKFGEELFEFELKKPIEGIYVETQAEVGKNKSSIHSVKTSDGKTLRFWGTKSLDPLFFRVKTGSSVRITLEESAFKFNSGRVGKRFSLFVDE